MFSTRQAGTCYAAADLVPAMSELELDREYVFSGTIFQHRGRYVPVIQSCTPAVEAQLRQQLGPVKEVKVDIRRGHRSPFSRQVDRVDITLAGFEARSLPGGDLAIGGGGDLVGKIGTVAVHARDFRINDLPVSELAAVTSGALNRRSQVVTRMEQRGWGARHPDPDDKRRSAPGSHQCIRMVRRDHTDGDRAC